MSCGNCLGCKKSCDLSFSEKYPRLAIAAVCVVLLIGATCISLGIAGWKF